MSDLEPRLDWDDIQGNVLGGFNKNHQSLIGLSFGGDTARAKAFVAAIAGKVTSLREVLPFKREHAAKMLLADGSAHKMRATWIAAAFSFAGLKLLSADADTFRDSEFRNGMAASSSRLGDPPGGTASWVVGGPGKTPDAFLIVAADDDADRTAAVADVSAVAGAHGLISIYLETGHNLASYSTPVMPLPSGHEHFGFKDGISQPGVRGVLPNGDNLAPRSGVFEPADGPEYAAPGQPLVCAGEFVLGYATQIDVFPRQAGPLVVFAPAAGAVAPAWARNGSFLVFRRLRQDVDAFQRFTTAMQAQSPGLPPGKAAAMLVGRWPSGAPLERAPDGDLSTEATDDRANAFAYGDDNAALALPNDNVGLRCPIVAHIRKVNPRDIDTDQGAASATLTHRILRRGIPYGPPLTPGAAEPMPHDRGLLFLSYQAAIGRQFEFLASRWMDSPQNPTNPSAHGGGMGFDLLLGQKIGDRIRFGFLPTPAGETRFDTSAFTPRDWVTATGGGYFFAPSISAMKQVLGA